MPMHPRPSGETSGPFFPSFLLCMTVLRLSSPEMRGLAPRLQRLPGFDEIEAVHGNRHGPDVALAGQPLRARQRSGPVELADLCCGRIPGLAHPLIALE